MSTGVRKKRGSPKSRSGMNDRPALHDACISLLESRKLSRVADQITCLAATWTGSPLCYLFITDPRTGTLQPFHAGSLTKDFIQKTSDWAGDIAASVLRTRDPLFRSVTSDPREPLDLVAREAGIRALAALPLCTPDKAVGVLEIFKSTDCNFGADEQDLLLAFSHPAALAIDGASAYEFQQTRVRQLSILNGIASSLFAEKSLDSLLNNLARSARILVDGDHCLVALLDPETRQLTTIIRSDSGTPLGTAESDGRRLLEQIVRERRIIKGQAGSNGRGANTPIPNKGLIYNWIGLSLIGQGGPLGAFVVINKRDGLPGTDDEDFLTTFALHGSGAIERIRLHEETERLAVADGLTGLYNHREFQKQLHAEVDRAKRYNREFSLLLLDIDHFKRFNDAFGHLTGDAILRDIALIIREQIRSVDFPARYGGEEFAIILPETPGQGAFLVAERIRNRIREHIFKTKEGNRAMISASLGVATFPLDADTRDEMIDAADQAMYFAKAAGRNAVCRYSDTLKSKIEKEEGFLEKILVDPKLASLEQLAAAIDARCRYFPGSCEAVSRYAEMAAKALGLPADEREYLRIASALHEIGIIGVPDHILSKPGPLSREERDLIEQHPLHAENLLEKVGHLQAILPAVVSHHERYDGTGYPRGLKGNEIPLLARILAVAEAYHAMTSARPYRSGMSPEDAARELMRNAGTQFDPRVVEAFIATLT